MTSESDHRLVEEFLVPIRKCFEYRPAFGLGKSGGLGLDDFEALYGNDSFYSWLGLDDPLVYTAHKAAGGLTSVYRQIGVGAERLLRTLLAQQFGLMEDQLNWSYDYQKPDGTQGVHTLDARINRADLNPEGQVRISEWLEQSKAMIAQPRGGIAVLDGVVFEVRQGYKSADSKRQNADLRFGIRAYQSGLLPAFAILSAQVSEAVLKRYRADGMLVLTGVISDNPTISTFAFFEQVVRYDLAAFFKRNSEKIQAEIKTVVAHLLTPHN